MATSETAWVKKAATERAWDWAESHRQEKLSVTDEHTKKIRFFSASSGEEASVVDTFKSWLLLKMDGALCIVPAHDSNLHAHGRVWVRVGPATPQSEAAHLAALTKSSGAVGAWVIEGILYEGTV